jgi:hypothetical protein
MSPLIFWMTAILLPVPVLMLVGATRMGSGYAYLPGLFMLAIWLWIWFWFRPTRFELSEAGLRLVWPTRNDLVHLRDIESVESLLPKAFKARYGRGMRIGAGGLWGGFGWCWTPKVMFRLYLSRLDRYIIVHTRRGRPLLITPARPDEFIAQLNDFLVHPG